METTVAGCHGAGLGAFVVCPSRITTGRSVVAAGKSRSEAACAWYCFSLYGPLVTVVPLFSARVTIAVVPVDLPEPWLVVLHEAQAPYPLGGLPEIEVRHQEARRPPVFGLERLAVVLPDHQRLSFQQILDRQIGRIAAIAKRHHEWGRWLLEPGRCEDPLNGDAAPVSVELGPARHTVNIHRDLRRTKRTKLLPAPRHDLRTVLHFEREGPGVQWGVRSRSGGQHGKIRGQVLSGREPFRLGMGPSALKAACDHMAASMALVLDDVLITPANSAHVIGTCVSPHGPLHDGIGRRAVIFCRRVQGVPDASTSLWMVCGDGRARTVIRRLAARGPRTMYGPRTTY